jgi:dienelactone hydrolase
MSLSDENIRTIDHLILRAANEEGDVSDDLVVISDVSVDSGGGFSLDWDPFVLPGPFSPTENPVEIDSVMTGDIRDESSACGEVTGDIVSFGMDLAGSTFATAKWEDRILGTPASCDEEGDTLLSPIETCPDMPVGRVLNFPSGGMDREYELHIPDDYVEGTATPLVFVLHGIGSSIDHMLGAENLLEEANRTGHIIVTPQALERGGTAAWDPVGEPGYNSDITLFDDLLTCMSEQYTIDPDRVHVTGMSLGGIFTGTLISSRSDVIASAAPFSGGLFRTKSDGWQPIPTVVSWGGPSDIYYGQDFEALAASMSNRLKEDGHFVVRCNHNLGHSLNAQVWPYTFRFFMDHPRDVTTLPYDGTGLPDEFPDYCSIMTAVD